MFPTTVITTITVVMIDGYFIINAPYLDSFKVYLTYHVKISLVYLIHKLSTPLTSSLFYDLQPNPFIHDLNPKLTSIHNKRQMVR